MIIYNENIWLITCIVILISLLFLQWRKAINTQTQLALNEQKLQQQTESALVFMQQAQELQDKNEQQTVYFTQQITALKIELAESNTLLQSERQQSEDKLALLEQAKTALSHQFQALAAEILTKTGEQLNQQQQTHLSQLIEPFKEKLGEFKTRVEELHRLDTTERTRLSEQVKQLMQTSAQVSDQTNALTRALSGQAKSQGDWGELVLERLLELAGLQEGQQYRTQHHTTDQEGTRQRPDVLLLLPEEKHLIIDSKVSLTAYTRYVNATSEHEEQLALNEHLASVRNHIVSLGRKNYPTGKGINSPDFVILFMPIEPALLAAARADSTLYELAWQHNVLLTSASTLLFVLRMVSQLWRNAQQQHNVQEIIDRGEKLLDKFNGFAADIDKIGVQIEATHKTWQDAKTKFSGKGGLLSQAHILAGLGIKPTKPLPEIKSD